MIMAAAGSDGEKAITRNRPIRINDIERKVDSISTGRAMKCERTIPAIMPALKSIAMRFTEYFSFRERTIQAQIPVRARASI